MWWRAGSPRLSEAMHTALISALTVYAEAQRTQAHAALVHAQVLHARWTMEQDAYKAAQRIRDAEAVSPELDLPMDVQAVVVQFAAGHRATRLALANYARQRLQQGADTSSVCQEIVRGTDPRMI